MEELQDRGKENIFFFKTCKTPGWDSSLQVKEKGKGEVFWTLNPSEVFSFQNRRKFSLLLNWVVNDDQFTKPEIQLNKPFKFEGRGL